jgi:hypothetical protein
VILAVDVLGVTCSARLVRSMVSYSGDESWNSMSVVPPGEGSVTRAGAEAPEHREPTSDQPDVEEALRMLTARLAEFVSREDALAVMERRVQRGLAEVAADRAELERTRSELLQARRELDERLAILVERETAAAPGDRHARGEGDAEQTLATVDRLRADLARELAEFTRAENARKAEASPASEREQAAERSQAAPVAAVDRDDARRLTELVRSTAKHEAETVLKKAHEEATLIREQARAERETPQHIPVEPDSTG